MGERKVRLKRSEVTVTLMSTEDEADVGRVYYKGKLIGFVWKGTRTVSPPLYPGSRVVLYHKHVLQWQGSPESMVRSELVGDTRLEVLEQLVRIAEERGDA